MPTGAFVTVDGRVAEVEVPDPLLRQEITSRLVAAARPQAWRLSTRTVGRRIPVVRAPVDIVERAGLLDTEFDQGGVVPTVVIRTPGTAPERVLAPAEVTPPPRTGRGSGIDAWRGWLTRNGIGWAPGETRAALIQRWDERGRP